ncbi:MAG: TIR domain-containing protein, partial [Bacteroidales bacterium]|nr:TIR domain-containing protein [Bacteroidales bacterium]
MSEEQNKNREKREFERGNNFDVFVSYRRSDGKSFAKTLNLAFKNEGFRCFLDYSDLEGGDFRKQLQDAVVDAPIFVMVMTPDYFARCVKKVETADGKTVFEPNEDDWVRREIDLALSNGKIIIPINMNGILKGTPDYLDEDFGNRVGCHQFSSVYDDDTFDSSFAGMLAKNIWNRFSKLEKPTDKAMVTVATDADCKLMKNNKLLATLQADEHSPILLGKGNHLLQARSEEFPQISVNVIKKIEDVSCDDFIIIELKDKVQPLRDEKIRKEEEEKKKREEEERQKEEEKRQQDNKTTSQQEEKTTPTDVPQAPKVESISPSDFRLLRTLTGHDDSVISVAVSPDGKYLASGSADNTVIIWDANNGECMRTLEGHSNDVRSVCWSPDGKYLASG